MPPPPPPKHPKSFHLTPPQRGIWPIVSWGVSCRPEHEARRSISLTNFLAPYLPVSFS